MVKGELEQDQKGGREGGKLDQALAAWDERDGDRGSSSENEQCDADRFQ